MSPVTLFLLIQFMSILSQVPPPPVCIGYSEKRCVNDCFCVWCLNGSRKDSDCVPRGNINLCRNNSYYVNYDDNKCQDYFDSVKISLIIMLCVF